MLLLTLPKGLCHSELFCKNSSEHEMLWNSKPRNSRRGYVIRVFNVLFGQDIAEIKTYKVFEESGIQKSMGKMEHRGDFFESYNKCLIAHSINQNVQLQNHENSSTHYDPLCD